MLDGFETAEVDTGETNIFQLGDREDDLAERLLRLGELVEASTWLEYYR